MEFSLSVNANPSRRAVLRTLAACVASATLPMGLARAAVPGSDSALLIVDLENCFVTGGTLPVPHGEDVVPVINRLARGFTTVIATQDWHTADHVSFAASHPGRKSYETIELAYGRQVLWPAHCVAGSRDADLVGTLDATGPQLIVRKGFHRDMDSYSAFFEADRRTATGLAGYLRERHVREVYVCGLATDFCVAWTALDACKVGFDTWVIEDACRGIDLNGSLDAAWASMTSAGVHRIRSIDIRLPA